MRQHAYLILAALVLFCQCIGGVEAASIATTPSHELISKRQTPQRGALGGACRGRHPPRCNTGLFCNAGTCAALGTPGAPCKRKSDCSSSQCFLRKCLGDTARPFLAPCSVDTNCSSNYCGTRGRCAKQHAIGKACTRAAQCTSGACDAATAKCIATTSTTPPSSGTSLTPPEAARAALALATSVANSQAFNDATGSRRLLQGPGQVQALGSVNVVSTAAGPAVELSADNQHPAVVKEVLTTRLSRRQTTTTNAKLTFNYVVQSATGQCNIVPTINDVQQTPFIVVTAAQQSGQATFPYTGNAIDNYALTLVCDAASNARVYFDSVLMTVTAPTTSPGTSLPALPTGACTGLTNCGFEQGNAGYDARTASGSGARCDTLYAEDDGTTFIRSGSSSKQCTLSAPNKFILLQGGGSGAHTYAAGSDYVWTFWVKTDGAATVDGLTCAVWAKSGNGATAYKGTCPVTTAPAVNGFRQVAVPFTAPDADMSFVIVMQNQQGSYAFDDLSMLDGKYAITYDANVAPSTGFSTAAPVQTCDSFTNCGFETGYLNGWGTQEYGTGSCSLTSNAGDVHSGKSAAQCTVPIDDGNTGGGIGQVINNAGMVKGTSYTFSFWGKSSSGGEISCSIDAPQPTYYGGIPAVTTSDAKGYRKYSLTFTATDDGSQAVFSCTQFKQGTYFFDDFSFAPTAASTDPSALPSSGSCSGLPNCSNEDGPGAVSSSTPDGKGNSCAFSQDGKYARLGYSSQVCTLSNSDAFAYLQGGDSHTYTAGSDYVWTFWVQVADRALIDSMTCVVWADKGNGAIAYRGSCPVTTAAVAKNFHQVAIPFKASSSDMSFMISMNNQGTYAFDDFSILDGVYTITYDTPNALTTGTATSTATQTCDGVINCGWETGFFNGYSLSEYGQSTCSLVTNSANVHSGQTAAKCTVPNVNVDNNGNSQDALIIGGVVPASKFLKGKTYKFSYWAKSTTNSAGNCWLRSPNTGAFYQSAFVAIDSSSTGTNGYKKFVNTQPFTVADDNTQFSFSCTFTKPDTYYFDDFALTQQ